MSLPCRKSRLRKSLRTNRIDIHRENLTLCWLQRLVSCSYKLHGVSLQIGGLEIFVDGKWFLAHPQPNTFVINIGDTFKAMTNGIYKSCLQRVLSNKDVERKTLAFFLNSKGDKTVRPPNNLLGKDEPRNYPDFTRSQFYEFTQKHFRYDANTLQEFVSWFSSKPSN